MAIETLFLLFFTGLAGGIITALAGGSSLITFPALIAVGLPPIIANATIFVTVLPANMSAAFAYKHELQKLKPAIWHLGVASVAGGIVGSVLLLQMSNAGFASLLPWLLLTATLLLAFGRKLKSAFARTNVSKHPEAQSDSQSMTGLILIFVISVYGGFFGAGLGVLMLAVLSLIGYDTYHEANALKNTFNAGIGFLGILLFGAFGLISWPHAAVLTIGSTFGAYLAVRVSHRVNAGLLNKAMIVIGFTLSAYYFWIEFGS